MQSRHFSDQSKHEQVNDVHTVMMDNYIRVRTKKNENKRPVDSASLSVGDKLMG
jgi:hypothetical protein